MRKDQLDIKFDALLLNIKKAKSLAFRDVKNHFVRNENSYYHYFDMRRTSRVIKRMTHLIESISTDDPILEKYLN